MIPAIGQAVDTKVLNEQSGVKWTKWKTIQTNPHNFMTDREAVFSGGDCQMGAKTIIECVAQGKLGARSIHAYLMGEDMKEVARRLELEERRPDLFDLGVCHGDTAFSPIDLTMRRAEIGVGRRQAVNHDIAAR